MAVRIASKTKIAGLFPVREEPMQGRVRLRRSRFADPFDHPRSPHGLQEVGPCHVFYCNTLTVTDFLNCLKRKVRSHQFWT
jgi:hypothetical protein